MEENNQARKRDEELKKILADYEKVEQDKFKVQQSQSSKKKLKKRLIFFLRLTEFSLLAGVLFGLIFVISRELGFVAKQPLWVVGIKQADSYKARECVDKLWQIREAIDRFYSQEKRFPDNFTELYQAGLLSRKISCPASREEYIISYFDGKRAVLCPEPEKHSLRKIWLAVSGGPPRAKQW